MNQINEPKDQTDENSPFGLVFGAYSTAFKTRDHEGLREAFHPDASVTLHDRRTQDRLELAPLDFFTRLYREIGDAEFEVETLKSRFVDGYLFADGTWSRPVGPAFFARPICSQHRTTGELRRSPWSGWIRKTADPVRQRSSGARWSIGFFSQSGGHISTVAH